MAEGDLAQLKRAAAAAARAGDHEAAIARFRQVAAAAPGLWSAPYNAGLLLLHLGRTDEAEAALAEACRRAPDRQAPHADHALALLALGREAAGWARYLWRREAPRLPADRPLAPLPADLSGRAFVLLNEQGLGDVLFFLRYAAGLRARGARLFHEPFAKLAPLLARVPWLEPVPRPAPDVRVPLGDLPFLAAVPPPPTLRIEPQADRVAAVARRLAAVGPGPYLGVTWHGGVPGGGNLVKTVPPALLGAAVRGWRGTVLVLQRVPAPGAVAAFRAALGRDAPDFSDLAERLEDMLALQALLDAHAAVSNTNVHLRAAAGRPSHVLVPWPAEFRWRAGLDRSPWFPDCPLYRQRGDGDWAPALAALAAAISRDGA